MSTVFWISLCVLVFFPYCSPQNLILATNLGIKTLFIPTLTETTLHEGAATSVDYRYNSIRDVYFISNSTNQIFYSYYSEYKKSQSTPVPRVTSTSPISSLAVDWVSYKLYYGSPTGSLFQESLRSSKPKELVSEVSELNNFALDPYKRVLFFTTNGNLVSVTLDSAVANNHHLNSSGLKEVTTLALDLHNKEVYAVYQRETDNRWVLVTKGNSDAAETTTVYVGEQLRGVRALTVYNGHVFWAAPCEEAHCLYSCQRKDCLEGNVKISWKSFEVINDVKFYSPLVQTPNISSACTLCSHGCSQDNMTCACPDDFELAVDGVVCTKKTPSWGQQLRSLIDGFVDECCQLYDSILRHYFYICGGLVLALLFCCLCLLATIPCSKTTVVEEYHLSERHHPLCPRRHIPPLYSIEE